MAIIFTDLYCAVTYTVSNVSRVIVNICQVWTALPQVPGIQPKERSSYKESVATIQDLVKQGYLTWIGITIRKLPPPHHNHKCVITIQSYPIHNCQNPGRSYLNWIGITIGKLPPPHHNHTCVITIQIYSIHIATIQGRNFHIYIMNHNYEADRLEFNLCPV